MIKLTQTQKDQLKLICTNHNVRHLFLFGSATGEKFDPKHSDIDLAVEFGDNLKPIDYADNFFSLLDALENMFDKKVDLLSYRALKNPVMIDEIERNKVALYAA